MHRNRARLRTSSYHRSRAASPPRFCDLRDGVGRGFVGGLGRDRRLRKLRSRRSRGRSGRHGGRLQHVAERELPRLVRDRAESRVSDPAKGVSWRHNPRLGHHLPEWCAAADRRSDKTLDVQPDDHVGLADTSSAEWIVEALTVPSARLLASAACELRFRDNDEDRIAATGDSLTATLASPAGTVVPGQPEFAQAP
jgi:hypothetical protein